MYPLPLQHQNLLQSSPPTSPSSLWELPTFTLLLFPLPLRPNSPHMPFYSLTVLISYTVCRSFFPSPLEKHPHMHESKLKLTKVLPINSFPNYTDVRKVRPGDTGGGGHITFNHHSIPSDSLFPDDSTLISSPTISPSTFITFTSPLYPDFNSITLSGTLRQHVNLRRQGYPNHRILHKLRQPSPQPRFPYPRPLSYEPHFSQSHNSLLSHSLKYGVAHSHDSQLRPHSNHCLSGKLFPNELPRTSPSYIH